MSLGMFFTIIWALMAIWWSVTEFAGIKMSRKFKDEGDSIHRGTFSWQIWWLRQHWWGRMLAMPVWGWAFYHFFFEPDGLLPPVWWDDWVLVALLAGLAVFIRPRIGVGRKRS